MLKFVLRHDLEGARSPTRGSAWIAETFVEGAAYRARSHSSASCALARRLVEAGIADQPVRASQSGVVGFIEWPSLHAMATRTISESATLPIRSVKWREFSDAGFSEAALPSDAM